MNPEPEIKVEPKVENTAQPNTVQAQPEPAVEETAETKKDIDWKRFKAERAKEREQAEIMAKKAAEKEAEAEALKAAMDAILNKQAGHSHQAHTNQFYEEDETEDQRIQKKVDAALELAERKRKEQQEEYDRKTWPERLRQNYPDFDQVCGADNIDYLMYHHPEIAKAFKHMPEGTEKWDSVYKTIKKLVPNTNPRQDQMRMEKNLSKPQSMSGVQTTQGNTQAPPTILTEERMRQNWERMERTRKGLS